MYVLLRGEKAIFVRYDWEEEFFGCRQQLKWWFGWISMWGLFTRSEIHRVHLLCQRWYNSHGNYLAIEEFCGGWQRGVIPILLPKGKKKWGWCGFFEVLCYMLSLFISVNHTSLADVPSLPAPLHKEVFGNVVERKKSLLLEIQVLDGLEEERLLVEEERVRRAKAKIGQENVALMQEISWRQKSRAIWLKEGDHNTRFFRHLANSHKRYNFISSFCIDDGLEFPCLDSTEAD